MTDTKPCRKCGEDKPLSSYFARSNGHRAITCGDCRKNASGKAAEQRAEARREQEAALKDEIWSAMWRGRSWRSVVAVQPSRQGLYRIKLRSERGFITVAELACRCAEREACHRAANQCRSVDAVFAAARILEQPTGTLERTKELRSLWRGEEAPRASKELRAAIHGEDDETDPFDDAFGDWAPAWVNDARASHQLTYSG